MKEDFVGYDLAVKLKEKGFNDECHAYYEPLKHCLNFSRVFKTSSLAENYNCIAAPTVSQVLKWLRDKKINVNMWLYKENGWYYTMQNHKGEPLYSQLTNTDELYPSYEAATIASIEYVLDNLI